MKKIEEAVTEGKKPRDPVSTKKDATVDADFLYKIDSTCQEIISEIIKAQLDGLVESIKVNESDFVFLKKAFSPIELKKLKTEYLKLAKMNPPRNREELVKSFVNYINTVQSRFV